MEFSFKYYDFLKMLDAHPEYMVIWASFGVPLLMLAFVMPFFVLRKIGLQEHSKPFANVIYLTLGITWILGFMIMMIMMFSNVSGVHMLLTWLLILITYMAFVLTNYKTLMKALRRMSKK